MNNSEIWWLVTAGAVFGLGVYAQSVIHRLRRTWHLRRMKRRASKGERCAERMLVLEGYQITRRQPVHTYSLEVDGKVQNFTVRADLLVKRGRQSFVAEIKTGKDAPHIGHRSTRRQILEYALAYDVSGILLVDADQGTVRQVQVPWRRRSSSSGWLFILVFTAAVAIGWWLGSELPRGIK